MAGNAADTNHKWVKVSVQPIERMADRPRHIQVVATIDNRSAMAIRRESAVIGTNFTDKFR